MIIEFKKYSIIFSSEGAAEWDKLSKAYEKFDEELTEDIVELDQIQRCLAITFNFDENGKNGEDVGNKKGAGLKENRFSVDFRI